MRCNWKPPPRELDPRGRVIFVCETCGNPVAVPTKFAELPVRRHCGKSEPTGRATQPKDGPGSELKRLIAELGLSPVKGCGCNALAARMNAGGLEWCHVHRGEILDQLAAAASKAGWGEWARAGALAAMGGWLRPADPFGSMLSEAIRRWEAKARQQAPEQ